MNVEELKAHLIEDPFDLETRRRYAEALESVGDDAGAAKQWGLLLKQDGRDFAAAMSLCRVLVRLEQVEEARSAYVRGQGASELRAG